MSLRAGANLGRYVIESPLGAGGVGDVYLAEDTGLHCFTDAAHCSERVCTRPRLKMDGGRFIHDWRKTSSSASPSSIGR